MRLSRRQVLRWGSAALLAAGTFPALLQAGVQAIGDELPDFELPDLATGKPVRLSDLRGQPVWLSSWASWCGPCVAEMPSLNKLHRRWSRRGLQVMGINLDSDPDFARAHARRLKHEFPSVIDERSTLVEAFGAGRIPLNLIVDREGLLRQRVVGLDHELLEHANDWLPALVG